MRLKNPKIPAIRHECPVTDIKNILETASKLGDKPLFAVQHNLNLPK